TAADPGPPVPGSRCSGSAHLSRLLRIGLCLVAETQLGAVAAGFTQGNTLYFCLPSLYYQLLQHPTHAAVLGTQPQGPGSAFGLALKIEGEMVAQLGVSQLEQRTEKLEETMQGGFIRGKIGRASCRERVERR